MVVDTRCAIGTRIGLPEAARQSAHAVSTAPAQRTRSKVAGKLPCGCNWLHLANQPGRHVSKHVRGGREFPPAGLRTSAERAPGAVRGRAQRERGIAIMTLSERNPTRWNRLE
jgi:hypothetical protein